MHLSSIKMLTQAQWVQSPTILFLYFSVPPDFIIGFHSTKPFKCFDNETKYYETLTFSIRCSLVALSDLFKKKGLLYAICLFVASHERKLLSALAGFTWRMRATCRRPIGLACYEWRCRPECRNRSLPDNLWTWSLWFLLLEFIFVYSSTCIGQFVAMLV